MTAKKFLKKIELLGFKSFADKTILPFAEGITGVVGPNGCGKSNISDAFRWVLGEQSAKSMRGGKMHDVIFAGTNKRKPLNYGEVTITIDNEDQRLPISFKEIEVTRRVHRSGESEYFLNRKHVRLKDVQDLFLESGVGKNAFAIFEQGKIDQIISYSPIDRRRIFEEAAGILRFLIEKERAMRKLGQVDQNMSRVQDIHQEVERQIQVLQDQVTKAKSYKANKQEFELLEKTLMFTRWERLNTRSSGIAEKEQRDQEALAEQTKGLERLQRLLLEKRELLVEHENRYKEKNEKLYQTRSDQAIKQREKLSCQSRLKELEEKQKNWQLQIEEIQVKQQHRDQEKETIQQEHQVATELLSSSENVSREEWEKVREEENHLQQLRQKQAQAQQEMVKLMQKEKQIESDCKQTQVHLEHAQTKQTTLSDAHDEVMKRFEEINQVKQEKQEQLEQVSKGVDQQKETFKQCEKNLHSTEENVNNLQEEKKNTHKKRAESEARRNVLLKLREEMEGFSPGTKKIMKETKREGSPLYKKIKGLYQWITPEGGAETAVSAVMRSYSQTLVVETLADFELLTHFAQTEKLNDYSVICLESLPAIEAPSIKMTSDSSVGNHFFNKMVQSEDVASGLKWLDQNPGGEVWTKDGAYIDRRRVVFYTSKSENNVFLREAELKTLEKELKVLIQEETTLDEALNKAKTQQQELIQQRSELDKKIRKEEMTLVEVNFSLQKAKNDHQKAIDEGDRIKQQKESIKETFEQLQAKVKALAEEHVKADSLAKERSQEVQQFHHTIEERSTSLKEQQQKHKERQTVHHQAVEEERKLRHRLELIQVQESESAKRIERIEEERLNAATTREELEKQVEADEQFLQDIGEGLHSLVDAVQNCDETVSTSKLEIEQLDQQQEEIRKSIKAIEQKLYQFGLDKTQAEASLESLKTDLNERYQLEFEELQQNSEPLQITIEQAERKLRSLRHSLEGAGDINMAAVEEYEKAKERFDFLQQQLEDLENSKQELIEIITKLDGESRTVFEETFEKIRLNFQKNFGILFKGGEADLKFTEAEDVLQAGVEIIAKPPEKQMRSIQLLSGGEKCLTALALLFAIFEVKPAPFCILDEVDAPLDDANIERFVNVVKQFTGSCQFIIITHSKRTMAICDRLFGVSMEERGVSKMLTVDFSREEAPEPILV